MYNTRDELVDWVLDHRRSDSLKGEAGLLTKE